MGTKHMNEAVFSKARNPQCLLRTAKCSWKKKRKKETINMKALSFPHSACTPCSLSLWEQLDFNMIQPWNELNSWRRKRTRLYWPQWRGLKNENPLKCLRKLNTVYLYTIRSINHWLKRSNEKKTYLNHFNWTNWGRLSLGVPFEL